MSKKALIVWGGWDGHQPKEVGEIFARVLKEEGMAVELANTLDAFNDAAALKNLSLIVPCWTMGQISGEQCGAVMKAVESGVGLAGCHGGMCDAFRDNVDWQFMTGGQFICHPGGPVKYTVNIKAKTNPLVAGIADFCLVSEQYYMHVDPAVKVLATTHFPTADGPHVPNGPVDMPVVWTKFWGEGRVYYNSLGHDAAIVSLPPMLEMMRGALSGRQGDWDFMIITIDGPAGAGKSTVAHEVARRLGYEFLDTGAMYRAIAVEAIRRQANLEDAREMAFVARHCRIEFDWQSQPPGVLLNGGPVSHLLRSGEVTKAASYVAVVPAVREMMIQQQRRIGREHGNIVTEGRDQGSVVFPDARLKFYLDASPQERARRRVAQLRARGEIVDYHEILGQIEVRDQRDSGRSVGPLSVPEGARVIDTTSLTQEQVIELMVGQAQSLMEQKT